MPELRTTPTSPPTPSRLEPGDRAGGRNGRAQASLAPLQGDEDPDRRNGRCDRCRDDESGRAGTCRFAGSEAPTDARGEIDRDGGTPSSATARGEAAQGVEVLPAILAGHEVAIDLASLD
jgi:hypothetical protein